MFRVLTTRSARLSPRRTRRFAPATRWAGTPPAHSAPFGRAWGNGEGVEGVRGVWGAVAKYDGQNIYLPYNKATSRTTCRWRVSLKRPFCVDATWRAEA